MTSQQTPKQGVLAIGTLHRTAREYFVAWRVLSIGSRCGLRSSGISLFSSTLTGRPLNESLRRISRQNPALS